MSGEDSSKSHDVSSSMVRASDSKEMTPVSPYTLYGSDNPRALITPVSLNGDNYNLWASEMLNALQAKRKVGFINGTMKTPSSDSPDYDSWVAVNSMVIGWIRSSIDPKVKSFVY